MASLTEIKSWVTEYLNESLPGDAFAERIMQLVHGLTPDTDSAVAETAHALNTKIAEVHLGILADYEFRYALIPYSADGPSVRKETTAAPTHYQLRELVGA
jgi:hypothetical protein